MTNHSKTQINDKRLIEDYLPIEAISAEARREKSVRQGHISTLHLWWARRPLVACRAAVFGALVPAGSASPEFVADLCTYPGPRDKIQEAQRLILQAHADRLTAESGEKVTIEDIEAGRAPRPRVLDMFAGGGAIPLEALRLGCEAYALDLNPVAHLIELCTLVYPQRYGQPDPTAKGSAKDGTWAGLAAEVEYWGKWVLERVKKEIGDLYPPIPANKGVDKKQKPEDAKRDRTIRESDGQYVMGNDMMPGGLDDAEMLTPVAYLWTRTVRCKNPTCGGTVPLVRQTWLAKKENRYVALRMDAESNRSKPPGEKKVRFRVVESSTEAGLGFDPADFSKGGNSTCPFCGTVADSAYVKVEGKAGRIGQQAMTVVCTRAHTMGKIYFSAEDVHPSLLPNDSAISARIQRLCADTGLTELDEPMDQHDSTMVGGRGFGFVKWSQLFTPRQNLVLLSFCKYVRLAHSAMSTRSRNDERDKAVTAYLGLLVDRIADFGSAFCTWNYTGGRGTLHTMARQALPMVWDFAESNPFNDIGANWEGGLENTVSFLNHDLNGLPTEVHRGSATALPFEDQLFDAIISDPPYYDNISYAVLSDFFYVWLKRSIGFLYPEHFSTELSPKKNEAIADAVRQSNPKLAHHFYERMMSEAFRQANRTLKVGGPLIIVYAHKTTVGWATLVDALRVSGFVVTEAWPLDTERSGRLQAMESSALASSIFLVARRREGNENGSYENDVQPELQTIVRERVDTLWSKGVTGADLVIACVGAGLRAFTRFVRVEYGNGEEVAADKFLAEVEGAVLETLLEKLFGLPRSGVSVVDPATRFYVLWRFAYRNAAIDAGEAIIFAYPQGVELDGAHGVSQGARALVEREKNKYRLRDFSERGENDKLGIRGEGRPAPLIDVLHRVLWLMESEPRKLSEFLAEARPNLDHLRVVAETLAGAKLAGNGSGGGKSLIVASGEEASALRKLTTNWRTLIEANAKPLV